MSMAVGASPGVVEVGITEAMHCEEVPSDPLYPGDRDGGKPRMRSRWGLRSGRVVWLMGLALCRWAPSRGAKRRVTGDDVHTAVYLDVMQGGERGGSGVSKAEEDRSTDSGWHGRIRRDVGGSQEAERPTVAFDVPHNSIWFCAGWSPCQHLVIPQLRALGNVTMSCD
jgi:hypothetical protein